MGKGKVSDELIALKKYASAVAAREPCDPQILWDPNYTAVAFRGRNLVLCNLRSGLNQLIDDTWAQLLALTENVKINVEVPPFLSEDLRSTAVGDSFIDLVKTDPPTLSLLSKGSMSLLRPSGRLQNGVEFEVDPAASQEFLHRVKPIIEAIAFLVHVTGSGPLRLSEVAPDRYRNGSGPRNLFISHGLVFLLRRELKSSTFRGRRDSVIHFPPQKVAELLVYYLAVVRPVEVFLSGTLGWTTYHTAYSQFLYVVKGRVLAPGDLSTIIARYTDQYFKCRLTGLQLRHVFISLQAVFLPPIVDPSVQKFGDSQAGHSTRTANHVYGQRIDHLPGEAAASFVLAYHWCKKLHALLGLGPEGERVRSIPIMHAPSEPTWWSPSDYIAPHPPPTAEILSQVHHVVNSAMVQATQQLMAHCEKVLKESVFHSLAALSAKSPPIHTSTSRLHAVSPCHRLSLRL